MKRRTALLSLGAIMTGGGALFGSGAFSQVTADRGVSVETAGDEAAFLRLAEASDNTAFVGSTGGTLELNLDGSGGVGGAGFNYNAVSYIEPLFDIRNDGDQAVGIRIGSNSNTTSSVTDVSIDGTTVRGFQYTNTDTINMAFYVSNTGTLSGDNNFSTSSLEGLTSSSTGSIVQDSFGNASNVDLEVGASVEVAFVIDSTGADSSNISSDTDLLSEMEVVAAADQA